MKKRLLALLLSALLLTTATACNIVPAPEQDGDGTLENTDTEAESASAGSTTDTGTSGENQDTTKSDTEESSPSDPFNGLTLDEYQEMVGCYVKTESGNRLENLMKEDLDKLRVSHEDYGSNMFHITVIRDNTEYKTTVSLSEGVRVPDIYSGFINDLDGYVIIFHMEGHAVSPLDDIELACVLKTADGGITWDKIEYQDFQVSSSRDIIIGACFFTDQIGFLTARYYGSEHFGPRTLWTLDGGKTWERMPALEFPNMLSPFGLPGYNFASEVSDAEVVDGTYLLTVRICCGYRLPWDSIYVQFASTDLRNWELLKEPLRQEETGAYSTEKLVATLHPSPCIGFGK